MINSHHAHVVFFRPTPWERGDYAVGNELEGDHHRPFGWLQICRAVACLPPITKADVSSCRDFRGARPCPRDASQDVQIERCLFFFLDIEWQGLYGGVTATEIKYNHCQPVSGTELPLRREAIAVPVIASTRSASGGVERDDKRTLVCLTVRFDSRGPC